MTVRPKSPAKLKAEVAEWVHSAKPRASSRYPRKEMLRRMYTALSLGVNGMGIGYVGLANHALTLSSDPAKLKAEAVRTNETKGREILQDCRRVADISGVSPLVVWGVYVTKYVEAVRLTVNESDLSEILIYAALGHVLSGREDSRVYAA